MVNIDLNILVIIILIAYFFLSVLKKLSSKIMLIIGLLFLCVAGGAFLFEKQDLANMIATTAYYALIAGVILAFIEYMRESTEKKTDKYCSNCETKGDAEQKFCSECGTQLPAPKVTETKEEKPKEEKRNKLKLSKLTLKKFLKKQR